MNLIPVIREALGLEVNEEFKLRQKGTTYQPSIIYRFLDDVFEIYYEGDGIGWRKCKCDLLGLIIEGEYEVVKIPFKPKEGEYYYFIDVSTGYVCRTIYVIGYCRDTLRNCREMLRISSGNCYQTEEEAEKHVDEWMEKLYGEDWRELLK